MQLNPDSWAHKVQGCGAFFLSRAISIFITSFGGYTKLLNTYITLTSREIIFRDTVPVLKSSASIFN